MEEEEVTEPLNNQTEVYTSNDVQGSNFTTMRLYVFPPEYSCFLGSAALFLFVFGLFGNVLTIAAIAYDKKLKITKASWLVASLSASDLLNCITVLPLNSLEFFGVETVIFNSNPVFFCKLLYYVVGATVMISVMSLLLITLNRYVAIVHNPWYPRLYGTKSVVLQIAFVWFINYTALLPFLLGLDSVVKIDERSHQCTVKPSPPEDGLNFALIVSRMLWSVWHAIVYILVMIGCYVIIFWRVRESRIKVESYSDNSTTSTARHSGSRTELKLANTMLITLMVLLLSGSPLIVVQIYGRYVSTALISNCASGYNQDVPMGFAAFAYICFHSSGTTNFLIYAAWHPQYRRAYAELLRKPGGLIKKIVS